MTPAKDSNLQVRIDAELLAEFRQYAEGRGTTMSRVLLSWIQGAVGGTAPPRTDVLTRHDERGDSRHDSDELVLLARRQVELLEQLVERSGACAGDLVVRSEERAPVVITPSAGSAGVPTPTGGDESDEIAGSVSRGEGKKRERMLEMWLRNVGSGGASLAPPGYEEMGEVEVREMAMECLRVMDVPIVEEVLVELMGEWKKGVG